MQYYEKRSLKVGYLSSQIGIADLPPAIESAHPFSRLKRFDIPLLIETILVTITAIFAIKVFDVSSVSAANWFVTPGILVTAAIIPTAIKNRKFPAIGFNTSQIRHSLVVLGWTCMAVFPATFTGCWLLRFYGLGLPLQPMLPQGQNWICWLFYQFMYVAVAEEVFFRGYIQGNILRLIRIAGIERYQLQQWISITLSAACFGAAHIAVSSRIISVMTFFPGLLLGWLFARTGSLIAPILFHGLANICYFLIASAVA